MPGTQATTELWQGGQSGGGLCVVYKMASATSVWIGHEHGEPSGSPICYLWAASATGACMHGKFVSVMSVVMGPICGHKCVRRL